MLTKDLQIILTWCECIFMHLLLSTDLSDTSGWKSGEGEEKSEIKLKIHNKHPHLLTEKNRDWLAIQVFTQPPAVPNHLTFFLSWNSNWEISKMVARFHADDW